MEIKRVLSLVIAILFLLSSFCFTACNKVDSTAACIHDYVVETFEADWHTKGGKKYTCTVCGNEKFEYTSESWSDRCRKTCENIFNWQIKSRLKDPDSVKYSYKIYVLDLCKEGKINYRLTYVITYNAKKVRQKINFTAHF